MSADTGVSSQTGVIHDIGYQRYTGERLGRAYSARSLYTHGLRTSYGLGRSAKAKIFPWIVVGIVGLVAVVVTAVRAQSGEVVMTYWGFTEAMATLVILFLAVTAPELVSRDIRGGVLPLYFSRPLTRTDYPLAKYAALVSATFLLLAGPQLFMFIGGAFTLDRIGDVWSEFVDFSKGLSASAVYAVAFSALAILVSSLAGRRAVAAALVVALFLVTTPIYGVMAGVAFSGAADGGMPTGDSLRMLQLGGLVSPMTLVAGVVQWWYPPIEEIEQYGPLFGGPDGPLYLGVTAALVAVSLLLLLLRYRKVAR